LRVSGETTTTEEIVIDLSNVPLKPLGKKEIMQLEVALIVGTLYRPEVLELIRDPIERSTWLDSLAVAAAALARSKAGLTVPQIAEELGRSEASIRSHLNQKTKAGKLIAETYEKLKKGELVLVVPFIKAQALPEEAVALRLELERLKEQNKALEAKLRELERTLGELNNTLKAKEAEIEKLTESIKAREKEVEDLRRELQKAVSEKESLQARVNELIQSLKKIRGLAEEVASIASSATASS